MIDKADLGMGGAGSGERSASRERRPETETRSAATRMAFLLEGPSCGRWRVGGWGMVSPEEPTRTRQSWKIDVTVRKEEAASGLTPGGGDRTAGTRAPKEGGTEPGPESLAEAGMQARAEVVSRHGDGRER